MRTISESNLSRLKKRKGVSVKRKLGGQKLKKIEPKPSKPAVPDNASLSGDKSSELSASASRVKILELMIGNNTRMIESLRKAMDLVNQILNRPRERWTHNVKRSNGLISSVTSTSESRTIVHRIHRDSKSVIDSITTESG